MDEIYLQTEEKKIEDLQELLKKGPEIKDGYIIKEGLMKTTLEKYAGEKIEIDADFYSITIFDAGTELKITRDSQKLFFRKIADKQFDDKKTESEERIYYLKGKYDKDTKLWWEDRYSPDFKYPLTNGTITDVTDESRAGLKVKIYRDEEGEIKYFRFCGYIPVAYKPAENKEVQNA